MEYLLAWLHVLRYTFALRCHSCHFRWRGPVIISLLLGSWKISHCCLLSCLQWEAVFSFATTKFHPLMSLSPSWGHPWTFMICLVQVRRSTLIHIILHSMNYGHNLLLFLSLNWCMCSMHFLLLLHFFGGNWMMFEHSLSHHKHLVLPRDGKTTGTSGLR